MIEHYYNRRSGEYEQIYYREDPIWQEELAQLASVMKAALKGKSVLEVACGTGFWTEIASETAERITALDISNQMLDIARQKNIPKDKVRFLLGDAYKLDSIKETFNAGLANFWFSHVPKSKLDSFLKGFNEKLQSCSVVFMADNIYVPQLGGELVDQKGCEDTFKLRQLKDGSTYKVLKNYYSRQQLNELLSPYASNLNIHTNKFFWQVTYKTK